MPMTREQAINALVNQDVAKWGEGERAASERLHGKRTLGLALNELANRAELADEDASELRAEARKALTDADWKWLRSGGCVKCSWQRKAKMIVCTDPRHDTPCTHADICEACQMECDPKYLRADGALWEEIS